MSDEVANASCPLPGWELSGATTDHLDDSSTGVWLVTTVGSQHVWDFSRAPYIFWTRRPGVGSPSLGADGQAHRLTLVEAWPRVGASTLVFFDDPHDFVMEQWRISSPIVKIEELVQVPVAETVEGERPVGGELVELDPVAQARVDDALAGRLPLTELTAEQRALFNRIVDEAIREGLAGSDYATELLAAGVNVVYLDGDELIEKKSDGSTRKIE